MINLTTAINKFNSAEKNLEESLNAILTPYETRLDVAKNIIEVIRIHDEARDEVKRNDERAMETTHWFMFENYIVQIKEVLRKKK